MKRCYVQCAEVLLTPGSDSAAPGGAVTLALCGSWDHHGPCRWPHETSAEWDERRGRVRVIFVADAEDEKHVRALIGRALVSGECVGPDGKRSHWEATEHGAGIPDGREEALGARIAAGPGAG